MDEKLINYIQQARQQGKKDEEIKEELLGAGWQKDAVNEQFGISSDPKTESLDNLAGEDLSKLGSLNREHIDLDKKHLAVDKEHIAMDRKHRISDRVVTVMSILAICLAGAVLFYFNQYQSKVSDAEQRLSQLKGIDDGQEQKITLQQQEIDSLKQTIALSDIPAVVKQWEPRMAYIECYWKYIPNVQPQSGLSGSGLLVKVEIQDGRVFYDVFTNRHILENLQGRHPDQCIVGFPPKFEPYTVINDSTNIRWGVEEDWGLIKLNENPDIVYRASNDLEVCSHPVELGERILVLGYPNVGSQESVTSTDGIISGYDGVYYVTDAKFEHGSSGGVAILLKNNCYLGVPTRYEAGTLESFGRILRSEFVLDSTQK